MEFKPFPKIPRLSREIVITEKLDGTNAQIHVTEDGRIFAGSRTRWITPENDNYGFARWVFQNEDKLLELGPGSHFGEWWGVGIQRGYDLLEKRFSLFNVNRWGENRPDCCHVVPVLYRGIFDFEAINGCIDILKTQGSQACDFNRPEGVVVYHSQANQMFKKLIENDEIAKSVVEIKSN